MCKHERVNGGKRDLYTYFIYKSRSEEYHTQHIYIYIYKKPPNDCFYLSRQMEMSLKTKPEVNVWRSPSAEKKSRKQVVLFYEFNSD